MEILFALGGKNKNNHNCLLLAVIDDIKLKNSEAKPGILIYHFEGVDFVRQYTKYEDLYAFIKEHENDLKKYRASTFATLDVLTQNLDQIYDSLEQFLNAYFNNIPYTFSIQFSLSSNVYNLILLETILGTFDSNKISLYLHRFKNTPITDTWISLYIRETKLPRIDTSKYNMQFISTVTQLNNQSDENNVFANTQKNSQNSNTIVKQENQMQSIASIQEIKNLLTEFKQEILAAIQATYNKQNLNKYQLSLIELIEKSDINEHNYQLIYNTIKTILNNTKAQNHQANKTENIFDELDNLNLNDIV
ncbi:MAG: hypothetical protein QW251_05185 [Desulfurococcaceae archaeon]